MQLITRNNASVMIQKRMKTGKRLHVILTTWKRDRKIEITQNGGNYQLNENGFKHFQASKLNQQKCISVLKERMNHGPRFWELLDSMTGGRARALRAELRRFNTDF